jgi:hypothetical protein
MKRALAFVLIVALPHPAIAQLSNDQKVKCANAYEQAQRTRNEGLFRASREHMLVCADDACPKVLRNECVKWLGEIDNAMPTVLIVAKDDKGNELSDVSVSVDGTKVSNQLDGKALAVDPGTRTFRFGRAGSDTIEQKVLIREGEKRRVITVTFTSTSGSSTPSPIKDDKPAPAGGSSVPAATWILGGVGVVALAVSAPMYASYFRQKSELDDGCGKTSTCDPKDVDPVKRQLIYANVTSAIGVVALGTAVIIWAAAPSKSSVTAGIAPTPGGVAGSFRIVF